MCLRRIQQHTVKLRQRRIGSYNLAAVSLQLRWREQHGVPACPVCTLGDHKLTGWVPCHTLGKQGTMNTLEQTVALEHPKLQYCT